MNKLTFFFIIICFSNLALASFDQAPPSFFHRGEKAVFVDFIRADYKITYDTINQRALAESTIEFIQHEEGYPIFDLVNTPLAVSINGEVVKEKLIIVPGNVSKVRIPLKKLGKPSDIANMILFLCSDEASYITGQTFYIDGGMSLN